MRRTDRKAALRPGARGGVDADHSAMKHEETRWQTSDGATLYGQTWTPQAEPRALVCLVHGLGEHSGRYTKVAMFLTESGFVVTAMDLRGHGRSGGLRGHARSCEHVLQDILALRERSVQRWPSLPCFLYGHSLGGNLVLNVLLRHKPDVAGAVVTSPALLPAAPPPRWKILLAGTLVHICPFLPIPAGVDLQALSHSRSVNEDIRRDPLTHWWVSARFGLEFLAAGQEALRRADQLALPLLLMHGTADTVTSPAASTEFAARAGDACCLKLWEGLCHNLHDEPECEDVMTHLTQWLTKRLESARRSPNG